MAYKIKTTKRNTAWVVQIHRQQKEGAGWRTIKDSNGPIIIATRSLARNIAREYRNGNMDNRFRIAKVNIP